MSIMSIIRGKSSEKEIELSRKIDKIGAEANAKNNDILQEVGSIDHLAGTYSKAPFQVNGATKGLEVRLVEQDQYCQILELKIQPFGFSPAHTHPHYCVCYVEKGEVIDVLRDTRFDKGEWYFIAPHQQHTVQSLSGAVLKIFNTFNKQVAESIFANKGYDVRKISTDKLKHSPL